MINLKSKKFAISSVVVFGKDDDMKVKLSYITNVPDPEKTRTDKDGNVRPQFVDVVKYLFVDVKDLGEKFKGKGKNEISQVLLGKTISNSIDLDI